MNEENILKDLLSRALPEGGFTEHPGGGFRADSTAWATLALCAAKGDASFIHAARSRLCSTQQADGRISISTDNPDAFWPTPIAVLAWSGDPAFLSARESAVKMLLRTEGMHWAKQKDSPLGHDTSLRGWPWVEDTHSWIEPTGLTLMALAVCGYTNHARAREAIKMLLDRQLPEGGWNYGNTEVYGQTLKAMPDSTGVALQALSGHVDPALVKKSLDFLECAVTRLRTPLSLAWALLGLAAWGRPQRESSEFLVENARFYQETFASCPTSHLSLLFLALHATSGLVSVSHRLLKTAREARIWQG